MGWDSRRRSGFRAAKVSIRPTSNNVAVNRWAQATGRWSLNPFELRGRPARRRARGKQLLAEWIEFLRSICRVCRCDVVDRGRIGASPLGECHLHRTRPREHADHREISLVAPRLLIDPIVLVALLTIFLLDGPRFRACHFVVHREAVL